VEHQSKWDVYNFAIIQFCWDADRLDLDRVDIKPYKDYLSEEGGYVYSSGSQDY
jgi:hypothetical protein